MIARIAVVMKQCGEENCCFKNGMKSYHSRAKGRKAINMVLLGLRNCHSRIARLSAEKLKTWFWVEELLFKNCRAKGGKAKNLVLGWKVFSSQGQRSFKPGGI